MEGERRTELDFDLGEEKNVARECSHLHHLLLMQSLRSNLNSVCMHTCTAGAHEYTKGVVTLVSLFSLAS